MKPPLDFRSAPSLLFASEFRPTADEVDHLTQKIVGESGVAEEVWRACRREVELQLWAARCLAAGIGEGIAWICGHPLARGLRGARGATASRTRGVRGASRMVSPRRARRFLGAGQPRRA